ncbi:MAG: acetate kinase, partial [Sphingomonas sp.]|nr:acetate kinase [Sphingomonas sp.]
MTEAVLALNAGSSSLKFGLFEADPSGANRPPLMLGVLRRQGDQWLLGARLAEGGGVEERWPLGGACRPVDRLLDWLQSQFLHVRLTVVGHRIVHGGTEFSDPIEVDESVLERLDALTPLAPLHQPMGLEPLRRIRALEPALRQFACFDTAFHRTIAPPAGRYALPRRFEAEGIRRYGFHGLADEAMWRRWRQLRPDLIEGGRVVSVQLGAGCSITAIDRGEAVDTSMGFTPLEVLVMATRCGDVDPGVLLFLQRK